MTPNDKDTYLLAYSDANNYAVAASTVGFEEFKKRRALLFPTGMTLAEISTSLDRFFDTPENGVIPIAWGLEAISSRARGDDEATIQRQIEGFRKEIANGK